ncbi:MAG TPA: hypothetical protein PLS94_03495 [Prolixibacteraceae bacterium]|nr:hypothetical protein [Prolixibacteraceae bacterium]HPR59851.1 hypothetical protein [Prolixibacteraceae bacterium]
MKGRTEKNEYFNLIYRYLEGQLSKADKNDFNNFLESDLFLSEAMKAYQKTPRKLAYRNIEAIDYVNGRIRKHVPLYAFVSLLFVVLIVAAFVLWSVIPDLKKTEQSNIKQNNIDSPIVPDTLLFEHVPGIADSMFHNTGDSIPSVDTLMDVVRDEEKLLETNADQPKKSNVVKKKPSTPKRVVYEPIEPLVPIPTDISQNKDSTKIKSLDLSF